MSVVGFDLGTQFCTIAVAQRRGIDVIANEASNRKTPALVAVNNEGHRFLGEAAAIQQMRNIKNTISDMKRLIGHKFAEKEIQEELQWIPYELVEIEDGQIGVNTQYNGEKVVFTPTQLTGMLLHKLKDITEKSIETKMKDVVIAVPSFWTDHQRRALVDAATLGGLNVLRLINETTATALAYGIYKKDLPEEPLKVMFFDMGYASLQVSIVAFSKGKMEVLGTAWDRSLGGKMFDREIFTHLVEEFKKRYHIDVKENPKAILRLQQECDKAKCVLSANKQAPINISCIMNDIDVASQITREQFEELTRSLCERILVPIKEVLAQTGLSITDIASIEAVGGAHRIPAVKNTVKEFFGREMSSVNLNAEESVAKGAALQCALLSPSFRVNVDYKINERSHYPVELIWRDIDIPADTSDKPTEIFKVGTILPGVKMITFPRGKPFEMVATYGASANLPEGHNRYIGKYTVPNVPLTLTGEQPKLRVKVKLTADAIFTIEYAQTVENLESEEPETSAHSGEEPMEESDKPSDNSSEDNKTTEKAETNAPKKEEEKKDSVADAPKKTKVKRTNLKIQSQTASMSTDELEKFAEEERRRIAKDEEIRLTEEAKDSLERYVYEIRGQLTEELNDFVPNNVKEEFTSLLFQAEDWLYGDGEFATKEGYRKKLSELQAIGNPIKKRYIEARDRPSALATYNSTIERIRDLAFSEDPKYSHIPKEEREKILERIKESESIIKEKLEKTEAKPKTEDPIITCADILQWAQNVENFARPIMSKPKPAPPKEEKKEEPATTETKTEESTETDGEPMKEEADTDAGESEAEPMATEGSESK